MKHGGKNVITALGDLMKVNINVPEFIRIKLVVNQKLQNTCKLQMTIFYISHSIM